MSAIIFQKVGPHDGATGLADDLPWVLFMGHVAGDTGTIFVEVFVAADWLCGELEAASIYHGNHWGVFREPMVGDLRPIRLIGSKPRSLLPRGLSWPFSVTPWWVMRSPSGHSCLPLSLSVTRVVHVA